MNTLGQVFVVLFSLVVLDATFIDKNGSYMMEMKSRSIKLIENSKHVDPIEQFFKQTVDFMGSAFDSKPQPNSKLLQDANVKWYVHGIFMPGPNYTNDEGDSHFRVYTHYPEIKECKEEYPQTYVLKPFTGLISYDDRINGEALRILENVLEIREIKGDETMLLYEKNPFVKVPPTSFQTYYHFAIAVRADGECEAIRKRQPSAGEVFLGQLYSSACEKLSGLWNSYSNANAKVTNPAPQPVE